MIFRRINKELWGLDGGLKLFFPDHKILMEGGKIMERMFTMEVDEFNEVFK